MKYNDIQKALKQRLKPKRYKHTLGVVESAERLTRRYGGDVKQAKTAALLHDCAKNMDDQRLLEMARASNLPLDVVLTAEPGLLHGAVGAVIAKKEFGIDDPMILDAITYHTTGRTQMTTLDKIIYLADYIEPNRDFPGVEALRTESEKNLEDACVLGLTHTIRFVLSNGGLVHPLTVEARNDLIIKNGGNKD